MAEQATGTEVPTAAAGAAGMTDGTANVMQVVSLPIDKIRPAPWNARRYFNEDSLDDLGKSLLEVGQLAPVIVRMVDDQYELVAGERRFRAAKRVGMTHLQAVISDNEDRTVVRKSLAENLDREDLNPWDHLQGVLAYLAMELAQISTRWPELVKEHGDEIQAAAKIVSLSSRWFPRAAPAALDELGLLDAEPLQEVLSTVFDRKEQEMSIQNFRIRRLRLLRLPEDLIESLQRGELDLTRVLHLDRVKDAEERRRLMDEAQERAWTADELGKAVAAALQGNKRKTAAAPTPWERLSALRSVLTKTDQLPKAEQRQVERLVSQLEKLVGVSEDDSGSAPA